MNTALERNSTLSTNGLVLHSATGYDFLLWFLTLGRERALREKIVRLARLQCGESVLDVGCGTGTLAITAKRQVGQSGIVYGVDASKEMIARASKKASRADLEVVFENALAEALPFPDAHFDVVLTTVMLHHLPKKTRQQCAHEIRRVLKPGGRVLAVDFDGSAQKKRSLIGHFHRHSYVNLTDLIALFSEAGLNPVESGPVGVNTLHFVLAVNPITGLKP